MRTFAVLILLLNLGYLAWNQLRQTEGGIEDVLGQPLFVPAEQSLTLLAEFPSIPVPTALTEETLAESVQQIAPSPVQETNSNESPLINPIQTEMSPPRCDVASGFADQNEATTFITEISEMGVAGRLEVQQEQISSTWWVHLPPYKSQIEAQSVIDELAAKGIDNFYMRTGELAGGISLGVFSQEQSATTAQSELLSRGYNASIKEIPRYVSKTYVIMEASDPMLLEAPEWMGFLATKPKLEVTEKLCETIAR